MLGLFLRLTRMSTPQEHPHKRRTVMPKKAKLPIVNRELSWLSFNDRVLQEAHDPTVPLIERIKFMGIFSSNLDEFFRVRVASINRLAELNIKDKSLLGQLPKKILAQIQKMVIKQQQRFETLWNEVLIKELAEQKIFIINEKQLNVQRGHFVKQHFLDKILPTLVPVMVDHLKDFPVLRDKTIYLFVRLSKSGKLGSYRHAIIEIPSEIHGRFLVLPETNDLKYIILLDDVIRYCLEELFPIFDYNQYEAYTVKITRDAELDLDNDVSRNFLEIMAKGVKQRKKGRPVRFVYDAQMPADMVAFLVHRLSLKPENLIPGGRYHNFKDFIGFPNVGSSDLEYPKLPALRSKSLTMSDSLFEQIAKQDHLLFFPYQSFDYVIHFLREAAIDQKVKSIKITLYRVANHSAVINALINAVRNGKKVTVLMEVKARFDEENNIYYAQKLIDEGVNVIHGIHSLKVHSKICLVTRREKNKNVHYANLATGNFNERSSHTYSDFSLFTADKHLTGELQELFNLLEKGEVKAGYKHLLVAPLDMRKKLFKLIDREIAHAKKGKPAEITAKLNSLVDESFIERLYKASQAGVKIRLIIRGICCLVPGVKGFSENIEVISIVDRFLEHSRVFIFANNGKEDCFLSSADWMTRNLDHRVEVGFPVKDRDLKAEVKSILEFQWQDTAKARIINKQQNNRYRAAAKDQAQQRSQMNIYAYLKEQNS